MYTHVFQRHVPYSDLLRWAARASAVSLFVAWLGLVVFETMRSGPPAATEIVYQAVALAVVFAGYALGWRAEFAGGVLILVGTAAFFAACYFTVGVLPPLGAAWFAAPGVLYLLVWQFGDEHCPAKLPTAANRTRRESLARNGSASN